MGTEWAHHMGHESGLKRLKVVADSGAADFAGAVNRALQRLRRSVSAAAQ